MIGLKQKGLNILTSDFSLSSTVQPVTILFCFGGVSQIISYYLAQNISPITKIEISASGFKLLAARHLYFS